jgi:hypothetical protein
MFLIVTYYLGCLPLSYVPGVAGSVGGVELRAGQTVPIPAGTAGASTRRPLHQVLAAAW